MSVELTWAHPSASMSSGSLSQRLAGRKICHPAVVLNRTTPRARAGRNCWRVSTSVLNLKQVEYILGYRRLCQQEVFRAQSDAPRHRLP